MEKFQEVLKSVIPIVVIVLLIHFLVIPIPTDVLVSFVVGAAVVIAGLTIFLAGVDIAVTPIGEYMGEGLAKSNKLPIVVIGGLILGVLVTAAEPSLNVLGQQISTVTGGMVSSGAIIAVVAAGVGIMISIGLMRIVYSWSLIKLLTIFYLIIFVLSLFTSTEFLSIAFDASGATTGAITVPFILALAAGVASLKKNTKESEDDSFGLVAIASVGAIIAVMIYNLFIPSDALGGGSIEPAVGGGGSLLQSYFNTLTTQMLDVLIMILPITILFFLFQTFKLKLPWRRVRRIWMGMIYVYAGLVLFLTGVNAGFMGVGSLVGYSVATEQLYVELSLIGAVFGVVTILAEPAVSVLTQQIQEVTAGAIKRGPVLIALCVGVGLAIFLTMIRMIVPWLELWHILLPGYIIAIGLTYVVPKVFVGMAFDAGGVATGPITATFILAFVQGAAEAIPAATILTEGFGMIALVALMPILTLQILGFVYELQKKKNEGNKTEVQE